MATVAEAELAIQDEHPVRAALADPATYAMLVATAAAIALVKLSHYDPARGVSKTWLKDETHKHALDEPHAGTRASLVRRLRGLKTTDRFAAESN
ncbi:hypothetical protein BH11PLA2_BH11PLA2_48100 [soil metagenome]